MFRRPGRYLSILDKLPRRSLGMWEPISAVYCVGDLWAGWMAVGKGGGDTPEAFAATKALMFCEHKLESPGMREPRRRNGSR